MDGISVVVDGIIDDASGVTDGFVEGVTDGVVVGVNEGVE